MGAPSVYAYRSVLQNEHGREESPVVRSIHSVCNPYKASKVQLRGNWIRPSNPAGRSSHLHLPQYCGPDCCSFCTWCSVRVRIRGNGPVSVAVGWLDQTNGPCLQYILYFVVKGLCILREWLKSKGVWGGPGGLTWMHDFWRWWWCRV